MIPFQLHRHIPLIRRPFHQRDTAITELDILRAERDSLSKTLDAVHRRLVANSPLFDGAWYLKNNPDVAEAGFDPLDHYLSSGATEGRSPGPRFDPGWYLSQHPDVASLGVSPLLHYLERGGVQPQPPRKEIPPNIRINFPLTTQFVAGLQWYDRNTPDVSIVILSYLRPDLVENLIKSILLFTDTYSYEIIVVDNGSPSGAHYLEKNIGDNVRVITLNSNHYIGDAYNIGVEQAKGKYAVLMNNDIVVTKGWLSALIDQLQRDPEVGIVGPKFLYPSGELQEAGAFIGADGRSIQRGKRGNADDWEFNVPGEVDYCTGACIAIDRELYIDVLGYDWRWAPGYYEDVDLCFKIKDRGLSVFYVPESVVFHIESVTMSATPPSGNIGAAIEDNRITLLRKWAGLLEPSEVNKAIRITPPDGVHLDMFRGVAQHLVLKEKTLAILLPYELIPGGGEKYCLSILEQFSSEAELFLVFRDQESALRVNSVVGDLGFKKLRYHVITLLEAQKMPPFDIFILLGHELFPTKSGLGRKNFYICQFPFPLSHEALGQLERTGNYRSFERYIVYSKFVERHVVARLTGWGVETPVSVVEPPVDLIGTTTDLCQNRIIGVGRFFAGGHNKRHDILIEAMRNLVPRIPSARLNLAGAVHKEELHRLRLRDLRDDAADLPVSFHVDIGREELEDLYRQSSVYWHAAGWGVNVDAEPERAEHFGITVLEAMSAGCIPIVYAAGGPLEVVKHGINGVVVASVAEMVDWTVRILENWDTPLFTNMRQQALQTAKNYDKQAFGRRLRAVVGFPDDTDAVLTEGASGPRIEPTPVAKWQQDRSHVVVQRSRIMQKWLQSSLNQVAPSSFWRDLGAENLRQLNAHGVLNFKRTVNQNYFNWPVEKASDPQMQKLLSIWARTADPLPLEAELRGLAKLGAAVENKFILSTAAARTYTLFVGLLWWYATSTDVENLAPRISESDLGNPVDIRVGSRRISQDLANSLREWQRMSRYVVNSDPAPRRPVVAEIGAGYGRLAAVAVPSERCRYWVFDIPPALALSEWYLSTTFSDKRVFRWRPFSDWQEVEAEVADADLAFFSIDQLPLIPDRSVAVFAAISVLQEMLPQDCMSALRIMAAKTANAIYTKSWTRWHNVWDGFVFESSQVLPPEGWAVAFDREDDVHAAFTEKLFIRGSSIEPSC